MKRILCSMLLLIALHCTQAQSYVTYIDSFAKAAGFNGVVLIQEKNKLSYQKSFGYANLSFKIPSSVDTKYKIASITKLFTSVLIMQLYEQGRLELSSTIGKYLPEYKGEAKDKVTVHQLLNHTSGISNMDTVTSFESALNNGLPPYQHPYTLTEVMDKFCSGKLVKAPGSRFDYNNADYVILSRIIEKLYNQSYDSVLQQNILKPLQLKNTGVLHQRDMPAGLADTYFYRDDLGRLAPDFPVYPENWYGAGSMYSTVADLLQFSNALFGIKLLKAASLDKMFLSGKGEYGYGVWVYEDYDIKGTMYRIIKRPGMIMGAQSMLFHIEGTGSTIILLSNTGNISLDEFAAKIAANIQL
ncbi:beta-lactamase family protein [Pseudoflavitalea sp. G-6-1-2]|uniref:serine hydrolase domain-containing protein n=1 Tax=Pseudoflavitalea sp. G-6-1-2 TaxID=2728841 RepID=UPI00146C9E6A|nr:serine hydrolase domain-containing protein [Pseudoflavitalea sp. G-6-1-2]NML23316.1 beta-lactamase family protein [Pseudoflavitalea sp. G-6-1-2]